MNANPNEPGVDPGRPDEDAVKAAFKHALEPIEGNMNN